MVFIGLIILTMCIFINLKLFGTSADANIDSGMWGFALGFVISLVVVGSINVFSTTFLTYKMNIACQKSTMSIPTRLLIMGISLYAM